MCKLVAFALLCQILTPSTVTGLNEDATIKYKELAKKYGYEAEEYHVITQDRYNLSIFRIPGWRGPILLMHGILDSSDTWMLRGNTSLAVTLARQGYDIWSGNCRGNRYSRSHIYLDPDSPEFWNFSFHEHGYYDLPAIIDTVLELSGAGKLNAIAHSQGATIFYVLCSTRPKYNEKVNVLIGLAPVAFLHNSRHPLKTLINFAPLINKILKKLNINEVLGSSSLIKRKLSTFCTKPIVGYIGCVYGWLFSLSGYDFEELEPEFVETGIGHVPSGTSRKNLKHFAQVGFRKQFAQFDYGRLRNFKKYNSSVPPTYNLGDVSIKVALFVGANDRVSTVEDVELLRRKLPNVVKHVVIPRREMNHIDFVWGRRMSEYLFPYIFEVLKSYDMQGVQNKRFLQERYRYRSNNN